MIQQEKKQRIGLSNGNIAYLEMGERGKPPVLFVHGIPTSGYLWRHVMSFMSGDYHCFAPDLMGLGDSRCTSDPGRYDMASQAEMLVEFMQAQGHARFSLVAHDQGGAAGQVIASFFPERLVSLVLTDCVCYDNWPVPVISRYQSAARLPGLIELAGRTGFIEWWETRIRHSAFRKGVFHPERLDDEAILEYLRPLRASSEAREGFISFLKAGHCRYTVQSVEGLKRFQAPTLILWAADDAYISPSWGRKLFEDIPGAKRFELVPFCGHYWQEERPAEFSSHMISFLAEHATKLQVLPGKKRNRKKRRRS